MEVNRPHPDQLWLGRPKEREPRSAIIDGLIERGVSEALALAMTQKAMQWNKSVYKDPQNVEVVDDSAWKTMAEYTQAGVPDGVTDWLRATIIVPLARSGNRERTVRWLQSVQDGRFLIMQTAMVLKEEGLSAAEILDLPFTRQVLDGVKEQGPPERWGNVLRAMRLYQMTEQFIDSEDGVIREDRELAELGLLQGDAINDWRVHAQELYPGAPWIALESLARKDELWDDREPPIRQTALTLIGISLHNLYELPADRKKFEGVRKSITDWEQEFPIAACDEMRFIYAASLYLTGHADRGQLVATDMRTPQTIVDLVETLLDWEQADNAWKLTRRSQNSTAITHILLSGTWPDAPNKRQKLQQILEPVNKKNMHKFPPWLRIGCLDAMAQIYKEEGHPDDGERMARAGELVRGQLSSGYFNYRGKGEWS